jgi:hypothetical protein
MPWTVIAGADRCQRDHDQGQSAKQAPPNTDRTNFCDVLGKDVDRRDPDALNNEVHQDNSGEPQSGYAIGPGTLQEQKHRRTRVHPGPHHGDDSSDEIQHESDRGHNTDHRHEEAK